MHNEVRQIFAALSSLRTSWRSMLAFQLWFAALYAVVFGPSLAWFLSKLVRASGSLAVSNYELTGFFLSLPGILFLVSFSTINLALMFLNNSGLVLIAGAARHHHPVSALDLLRQNLLKFRRLAALGLFVLLGAGLLALPCAGIVALIAKIHLGAADINYYLALEPPEWRRAKWQAIATVAVFGFVGGWAVLRLSLGIQYALYSDLSPLDCLKNSWRLTKNRWLPLLRLLVIWWLGLMISSLAIGYVYTQLGQAVLEWSGLRLAWVSVTVGLAAAGYLFGGLAFGVIGSGVNEILLTNYFFDHADSFVRVPEMKRPVGGETRFEKLFRMVAWGSAIVALMVSLGGIMAALASVQVDQRPLVTAHRGSSAKAPENTLAALRVAIEDGADFAEIDVQQTADGQLVLMHDADFMRVSGRSNALAEVTLEQARQFDISGKFRDEFEGERIGTLQEAIDLVRGRMNLNIELKYNLPNPQLASDVVALIRKNDFADQCVLTSLDLAALLEVEALWPELETGLIVTAVVGDVTKIPVDFYSLNFARASVSFIDLAHKRGKDVHVWTINSVGQMNQMIEQGADNLITDVPDQVRELLRERHQLSHTELIALRLRNALIYGY